MVSEDPLSAAAAALDIAAAVRSRKVSAVEVAKAALARIAERDRQFNAFTEITAERALAEASAVDAKVGAGVEPGPLAGVPYAVKNLFDIEGIATLAGSTINRSHAPAAGDAALVKRMQAAGAVLTGGLNMDEYAYGFTTENTRYGPTRNPHDLTRIAGGSSGGSAAAVAGGEVPLSLGSDTNGSIRVPSSLCGIFGLKPTYGRLTRRGTYPFVSSLDHLGPFARSVDDLALCYDALQGADSQDPACANQPVQPTAGTLTGSRGLRIAVAGGYFERYASGESCARDLRSAKCRLPASAALIMKAAARARAASGSVTLRPRRAICIWPTSNRVRRISSRCRATASSPAH